MAREIVERAAEWWCAWAWRAGIASLCVLAVTCLSWTVLRRRASPHFLSRWLLLPLVPLLAPPLSPVGIGLPSPPPPAFVAGGARDVARVRSEATESAAARGPQRASSTEMDPRPRPPLPDAPIALADPGHAHALSWRARFTLGWWCLSLVLLLALAAGQRPLRRIAREARPPADAALRRRFARLVRRSGAPPRTELRLTDALPSPAVAGLLRPLVLVPPSLLDRLDRTGVDFVLLHELAHARRRDVPIELLARVARALWPLHPAAWFAPALASRERELACDEAALVPLGADAGPRAARGLVAALEHDLAHPARSAWTPSLFREPLSRRRVMRLLHPPTRSRSGLSAAAALALTLAALGAVPAASPAPPARTPAGATERPRDETDAVLAGALRTLVALQAEDGHWVATSDPDAYGCGELDDVGVTGAALLALLDAPASAAVPGRDEAVERGIRFLADVQDVESGWFPRIDRNIVAVPSHAFATRAWARARSAGVAGADEASLERAVAALLSARNPYAGWRYGVHPDGDNDAVITGWALLALAEARHAGIDVPEQPVAEALALLEKLYDPDTGRTGYGRRGEPTSRLAGRAEAFPPEAVEFPTAVAVSARASWGQDPARTDAILAGAALLARKAPRWSREDGTIDAYYWAFGTRAVAAVGGVVAERWRSALREALLAGVERDATENARWPAIDAWSAPGGETAMTAFCALALEAARESR